MKDKSKDYAILMLLSIYKNRPDLQKAFPEVFKGDLRRLLEWALSCGVEIDSAKDFLQPLSPEIKSFKKYETRLNVKSLIEMNFNPINFSGYLSLIKKAENEGRAIKREELFVSGPPNESPCMEIVEWVKNTFKGRTILDGGCGAGAYVKAFSDMGFFCYGVDIERNYVSMAKNKGLNIVSGDAMNLPYKDKTFDAVLLIEVLEHLRNPEKALLEAKRIAKQYIYITTPNIDILPYLASFYVIPHHFLEPTHFSFYSKKSLEKVLEKYFDKFEVEYFGRIFHFIENPPLYYQLRAKIRVD